MSGSAPAPHDPAPAERARPPRGGIGWWWLLVAVGAIALVTLLVAEPWTPVETEPTPTATSPQTPTVPPVPSATPSVSVAPPGADAVFDANTAPGLFVTAADLVADVPAAEPGVDPMILAGESQWGLPAGTTIEPVSCTLARTVVDAPPAWFDSRSWGNDALHFQQDVVLLGTPEEASEAFRELVTTVDACPEYRQVVVDGDGPTWTAEPAIEGQGVYPSIVLQQERSDGVTVPQYTGHMLVGNTIVSWTADALTTADTDVALATLGDPESLSAMVQDRAQLAVRALG